MLWEARCIFWDCQDRGNISSCKSKQIFGYMNVNLQYSRHHHYFRLLQFSTHTQLGATNESFFFCLQEEEREEMKDILDMKRVHQKYVTRRKNRKNPFEETDPDPKPVPPKK